MLLMHAYSREELTSKRWDINRDCWLSAEKFVGLAVRRIDGWRYDRELAESTRRLKWVMDLCLLERPIELKLYTIRMRKLRMRLQSCL